MTREDAIEWFETHMPTKIRPVEKRAYSLALSALRPVSRERVEKLRGEWQRIPLNMDPEYFAYKYNLRKKCSLCGYAMPNEYPDFNYCPNCRAKMDLEEGK